MATKSEKRAKKILIVVLVLAVVAIVGIVVWGLNYSKQYQSQGDGTDVYVVNNITVPSISTALGREIPLKKKEILPISSTKTSGYYTYSPEDLTEEEANKYLEYLAAQEGFKAEQMDGMTVMIKEFEEKQRAALVYIGTGEDGSFTIIVDVTPMLDKEEKASALESAGVVSSIIPEEPASGEESNNTEVSSENTGDPEFTTSSAA